MLIVEQNKCRDHLNFETDKDKREHGYGLKIINEIANKYDGNAITVVKEGIFEIHILLLFTGKK